MLESIMGLLEYQSRMNLTIELIHWFHLHATKSLEKLFIQDEIRDFQYKLIMGMRHSLKFEKYL